ncbi:MAG: hypothetical protein FJ291_16175 [Planctomycetes bacterium]|nr:hypothetical protein [Planctomycetota bacterium]
MNRVRRLLATIGMVLGLAAGAYSGGLSYDEALIPRFNIPRMSKPPRIDGTIDPAEWKESAKVMGMVSTGGLEYKDRPASFWLAWDPQHLYLAYRVDTLTQPVPHLRRAHREQYAQGVVFDDALEVGLFLHDLNQLPNQVSSYFQCILNSLGCGEYTKSYPAIGQNMKNWTPTFDIANRTYTDAAGKHWWEMEITMDLQDLQMPRPFKAGDPVDIGLFADVKNPNWQWLDYPSASGHLEHYGFPRAILTEREPYIQVEEIGGLHDEKLSLKSVVCNPAEKPVKVNAALLLQHGPQTASAHGALKDPVAILDEQRALDIPAKGTARFDVAKDFPGLPPAAKGKGLLRFTVTRADAPQAAPIYSFACNWWGKDKSYLAPAEYKPYLDTRIAHNPANGLLQLSADTLDAPLPTGAKVAGATYKVSRGGQELKAGKLQYFVNQWYDDLVELGALPPGKYDAALALVDAAGKGLVTAKGGFEKKDEAKEFSKWWNNKIGDAEKLLKPFEALKVQKGKQALTAVACTRRVYEFGSLGLPVQIEANGGLVLAAPARIVLKVGGREYAVPTDGKVKVTRKEDWRVDFECAPVTVAGITFSATGWMEQDGLVELALTYAPEKGGVAVEIEELRIEWPIAQTTPDIYMACMGQGGNYSARTIGAVPKGNGQVWNTRDDMGITGSGRRVGNFVGNLWVGTEQRGLLWCADSDRGWEPDARVAALAVRRDGQSVAMVNNLIGSAEGKAACKLTEPRTVRFGYNASPFRHPAPGWRLNQLSAGGSFSGGKYKVNWDTKQDFFSVLSPPFSDTKRWPEYYAHCKETVHKLMYEGVASDPGAASFWPAPGSSAYYGNLRCWLYKANQIALRGYAWKSIEDPNPYGAFYGDWVDATGHEFLSKTYRDYMIWLMDKQVKEGGCQHFYFDISFGEVLHRDLAAGFGYRLPDGSIQPESSDTNLREWYKRVWAMMQENDLYPGGVSGHATHGFSLKMFPFTDAILDSEYPMQDSIDVYPSDAMIALSCPHAFGTNIQHHGNFMNPTWPMMHDAAGAFGSWYGPDFQRWGGSRTDVEFIPYWRNQAVVKEITPGLIASLWKRPGKAGSAAIALMNYGPNPDGSEPVRAGKLTLDLKALGIPEDAIKAGGERVRIRQFFNCTVQNYYLRTLKWMQAREGKALPPIEPKLDLATGTISGFDINYHDVKLLVLNWEEKPVDDGALKALAKDDAMRRRLLDWGLNAAVVVPANLSVSDNPAIKIEAWKRTGDASGRGNSILLRVTNTTQPADAKDKAATAGTLKLDLKGLDVNVRKVWAEYTAAVPMDGQPVGLCESSAQPRNQGITYNAYDGELYYSLPKGQSRVFCLDRY